MPIIPGVKEYVHPMAVDGSPRKITWEEALSQTRAIHGQFEPDLQSLASEMRRLCIEEPNLSHADTLRLGYDWFWNKYGRRPVFDGITYYGKK